MKNVNAAVVHHLVVIAHAVIIRGRNGIDGVESGGECKWVRYGRNSSKLLIANNNYFYDEVRLAA